MLVLPSSGMSKSVKKHNVQTNVMCDWIEASVLFDQALSISDIVDVLIEEEIYNEQDFAGESVKNCWAELRRRARWMGPGYPLQLLAKRIRAADSDWQENASYTFCLLLSLAEHYDWWTDEFGYDYNDQGAFFEDLVHHSMQTAFPGWEFFQTGWTRANTLGLSAVVTEVAQRVGENIGDLPLWDESTSKEMGLDLLAYRGFGDGRQGNIVYLIQCASGADWKHKLKTPDLGVWRSLI